MQKDLPECQRLSLGVKFVPDEEGSEKDAVLPVDKDEPNLTDMDDISVEGELINVSSEHAMYQVVHMLQEQSDTDSKPEIDWVEVSPANKFLETKCGEEVLPQELKEDLDNLDKSRMIDLVNVTLDEEFGDEARSDVRCKTYETPMVDTAHWKEYSFEADGSQDTEDGSVGLQISVEGVIGTHCNVYCSHRWDQE